MNIGHGHCIACGLMTIPIKKIFVLQAEASKAEPVDLKPWKPDFPSYMEDLTAKDTTCPPCLISMGAGPINRMSFEGWFDGATAGGPSGGHVYKRGSYIHKSPKG